jgi:hypothetical protein
MKMSLLRAGMIASALGVLLARPGFAQQGEITSVTTNGISAPPGPLVPVLEIDTLQNRNDAVLFDAYLFTTGSLDFNLSVTGPGTYYIGYGRIFNETDYDGPGVLFSSVEADLLNAPSGSAIGLASYDPTAFSGITVNSMTSITFNGAPGIAPEGSASLYVGVDITGSGPQTFELELTPTVPEPSTLVLGLIGVGSGLGYAASRRWRRGGAK